VAGQAVVEFSLTFLVIFVIAVSALALVARLQAQIEVQSAVANAAASTIAAPLGGPGEGYAQDAFEGTLHPVSYLQPGSVTCTSAGYFSGNQADAGQPITCTGSATLLMSHFPVILWPNMTVTASASVTQPYYRQCYALSGSTSPGQC
jgi:hypothetical protein